MIRTTTELVAAIIEVDESIALDPFIAAASSLVDFIAVPSGHTVEKLTLIETWLSAHFYTVRDPRPTEERAGSVAEMYQSKVDLFLSTSHYGQMAMTLDTSGRLAALSGNKRKTVSATWLGKTQCEIREETVKECGE